MTILRRVLGAAVNPFRDRREAGRLLAAQLARYRGQDLLVLGIPRGGVPVAAEVADALDAELDVVVARKLGAPGQPELALGAVTANGGCFLNEDLLRELQVSDRYLQRVTAAERAEAQRREARFRGGRPPPHLADRTVIVVDDGLATGATMRAAVRSLRAARPAALVVAVPVGARDTCARLRYEADEVVCLREPDLFWAVGLWYEDFEPVDDQQVAQVLAACAAHHQPTARDSPDSRDSRASCIGTASLPAAGDATAQRHLTLARGPTRSRRAARGPLRRPGGPGRTGRTGHPSAAAAPAVPEGLDKVDEASWESFPASDAPGWSRAPRCRGVPAHTTPHVPRLRRHPPGAPTGE